MAERQRRSNASQEPQAPTDEVVMNYADLMQHERNLVRYGEMLTSVGHGLREAGTLQDDLRKLRITHAQMLEEHALLQSQHDALLARIATAEQQLDADYAAMRRERQAAIDEALAEYERNEIAPRRQRGEQELAQSLAMFDTQIAQKNAEMRALDDSIQAKQREVTILEQTKRQLLGDLSG